MYERSEQFESILLMLQDGPVQPGAHWHSKPWLDSTQLPPFRHGSDRQALSAAESQRERCYNVVLKHNQSKTETKHPWSHTMTWNRQRHTVLLDRKGVCHCLVNVWSMYFTSKSNTWTTHLPNNDKLPFYLAALCASACFMSSYDSTALSTHRIKLFKLKSKIHVRLFI